MKLITTISRLLLRIATVCVLSAATSQAEAPVGYELVFEDEFNSPQLDSGKWITTMHFAGAKGERYHNISYLNYNLDENILFGNGTMQLRTDRQLTTGTSPAGLFQCTGALVSTDGKFDFHYGYIEMRAKYPGGRGIWPVFWLMPTQPMAWPPEFDIAEYYAGSSVMHYGLCYGSVHDPKWDSFGDTDSEAEMDFHTYALEWSPGRAVWSQDGVVKKVIEKAYVPDQPMYIVLNNGVSSHIGPSGEPNAQTVFPNFFEIDYVRVYQLDGSLPAPTGESTEMKLTTVEAPVAEPKVAPSSPALTVPSTALPFAEILLP